MSTDLTKIERIDTSKPLPPKIEEAARIEALEGLSLTAIAERVGVDRSTLSIYKNHHPLYMDVRAEAAKELSEPFQALESLASIEVMHGLRKAVGVASKLLDYEVDGIPATATQLEAARVMAVLAKTLIGSMGEADSKSTAQAAAAVVIKFEGKEEDIVIVDGEIA